MALIVETKSPGLCSTCNNAHTCFYRKRRGFDALFCEMFDDYVPDGKAGTRVAGVVIPTAWTEAEGERSAAEPLKGLCVNCENRDACMFPKPEGGIWHCEEYK
ncbi:MAG: hypothetical protein GTN72_07165 [Candidatus Latescibacteria bacterium]|nr:hypothetical protein [Candidatus Latescibacterota bacterium]